MPWHPAGDRNPYRFTVGEIPVPGQLIAQVGTRVAWRVLRVDDVHEVNWSAQTRAAWVGAGEPGWETWPVRERAVMVEPARHPSPNGKDRRGILLHPWWKGEEWRPLTDPFPVCVDCGQCWPCHCHDRNKVAAAAMEDLDWFAAILPGCCWGCREPVTEQQATILFPGENLLLPGAPAPVFHTAASRKAARPGKWSATCRSEAQAYEEQWVLAGEGRRLRLVCPGDLFRHFGYQECSERAACPGMDASHPHPAFCTSEVSRILPVGPGEVFGDEVLPGHREMLVRPGTNCGHLGCRGPVVPDPGVVKVPVAERKVAVRWRSKTARDLVRRIRAAGGTVRPVGRGQMTVTGPVGEVTMVQPGPGRDDPQVGVAELRYLAEKTGISLEGGAS